MHKLIYANIDLFPAYIENVSAMGRNSHLEDREPPGRETKFKAGTTVILDIHVDIKLLNGWRNVEDGYINFRGQGIQRLFFQKGMHK